MWASASVLSSSVCICYLQLHGHRGLSCPALGSFPIVSSRHESTSVTAQHNIHMSSACFSINTHVGISFCPFQLCGSFKAYLNMRRLRPSSAARKDSDCPLMTNSVAEMSALSKSLDSSVSCLPCTQQQLHMMFRGSRDHLILYHTGSEASGFS